MAGRNAAEQSDFEIKVRKRTQDRIKYRLKEIQQENKKKKTRKCNCGRIK